MKFYNPFRRIRTLQSVIADLQEELGLAQDLQHYFKNGRDAAQAANRTFDQAIDAFMDEREDLKQRIAELTFVVNVQQVSGEGLFAAAKQVAVERNEAEEALDVAVSLLEALGVTAVA